MCFHYLNFSSQFPKAPNYGPWTFLLQKQQQSIDNCTFLLTLQKQQQSIKCVLKTLTREVWDMDCLEGSWLLKKVQCLEMLGVQSMKCKKKEMFNGCERFTNIPSSGTCPGITTSKCSNTNLSSVLLGRTATSSLKILWLVGLSW